MIEKKNMDLANWLLQIEKVAVLTNSQEYQLARAKSTSTPYCSDIVPYMMIMLYICLTNGLLGSAIRSVCI